MARPSRAAAALAGKQANKQATSPYFDKTSTSNGKGKGKAPPARTAAASKGKAARKDQYPSSDDFESEESDTSSEDSDDAADAYREPDSDAIDGEDSEDEGSDFEAEAEDEDEDNLSVVSEDIDGDVLDFSVKKKNGSAVNGSGKKKRKDGEHASSSPSKKVKKSNDSDFEEQQAEDEDASEDELEDGRKVVRTKLVKAPSHHVKPGLIDPHTMEFLTELRANNDREWFAKNDARYRHALLNWQAFVAEIQTEFQKGDWSIPEMPAKDLIHRIYRDVRFSNDKTPYKTNFAASFSRAGRKGPFAGYYLQISPGGRSLLAGGKWTPDKNDLATIRTNIIRSSKPFRRIINAPAFVKMFGPAKPDAKGKGQRCNVFGADDMLKVAPKMNGVDKTHKDIDLLKLRTIGVVHCFKDEDVIKPTFRNKVQEVVETMSPLVLLLNDMLHPQSDAEEEDDDEDDEEADVPDQDEQDQIEVTAASGKLCESAANDQEPVEEDDSDGMSGEGGIEEA